MLLIWQPSCAGPLRDRLMEYRAAQQAERPADEAAGPVSLPAGVRLLHDVPYGPDAMQRMDIYLPRREADAPVIFMVHGGGWRRGDKGMRTVVENKVARWVPRGFIFISANYRMLPGTAPAEQAKDIARALATAQDKAASLGGDPARFVLMGHSAGAHLAALLAASPEGAFRMGVKPWLGTVSLDSAALDVPGIMKARHLRLYDRAFGSDPAQWETVSPVHALSGKATPLLAVCSTRRSDACPQARRYAARAQSLDVHASVLNRTCRTRTSTTGWVPQAPIPMPSSPSCPRWMRPSRRDSPGTEQGAERPDA
jgi:acetyl esterase/lipase